MRRWRFRETWRPAWLMPSSSPRLGRRWRGNSLKRAMKISPTARDYSALIEQKFSVQVAAPRAAERRYTRGRPRYRLPALDRRGTRARPRTRFRLPYLG